VSVSTHKQALRALLFLYNRVLQTDFPSMDDIYRASRPLRLPTVLTSWEEPAVFDEIKGAHALIARLMHGTGMRLMECMTLRVKDVDFGRREIVIRERKGRKDRVTMLPMALATPLREQIEYAKELYSTARRAGRE
jgi:integrase